MLTCPPKILRDSVMGAVKSYLAMLDAVEAANLGTLTEVLYSAGLALLDGLPAQGRNTTLRSTDIANITEVLQTIWSNAALDQARLMEETLSAKASPADRALADYAESFGTRSRNQILTSTREQIIRSITVGMARGETQPQMIEALRNDLPRISATRASVIVRTESHAASQYTSQRLAASMNIPLIKRWNSVNDARTRDFGLAGRVSSFNHRVMNGTKIPLTNRFHVPTLGGGAEALLFPGDPTGSAGNIINCRCMQTYIRRG